MHFVCRPVSATLKRAKFANEIPNFKGLNRFFNRFIGVAFNFKVLVCMNVDNGKVILFPESCFVALLIFKT